MHAWGDTVSDRTYENAGNPSVVALIPPGSRSILDVGCGGGGNARLLRRRSGPLEIVGLTASPEEAARAGQIMDSCHVLDIEAPLPSWLTSRRFDAIVFSHVLEHLRFPEQVVSAFSQLLAPGGTIVIALPNVLHWRERLQFALGRFEYADTGVLDSTHLRFFTFDSAPRHLLGRTPELRVTQHFANGAVPLWPLRRVRAAQRLCERLDQLGCALYPNLFGGEILLSVQKC